MNKKIIVLIIVIFFLCGCGLLTFTPTQENSEADDLSADDKNPAKPAAL